MSVGGHGHGAELFDFARSSSDFPVGLLWRLARSGVEAFQALQRLYLLVVVFDLVHPAMDCWFSSPVSLRPSWLRLVAHLAGASE